MKKIILILLAGVVLLAIANINPTIVGNIVLNPTCIAKYNDAYRCFDERYIQRQYVNKECTKTWVTTSVCPDRCAEEKGKIICKTDYAEPKFTHGSLPFGNSPYMAIDFSEQWFSTSEDKNSDIVLKRLLSTLQLKSGSRIKVKIVDKPFDKATYGDCAEGRIYGNLELGPGKSACIPTQEGNMAVIGGYWQPPIRKNDILYWRYYILSE